MRKFGRAMTFCLVIAAAGGYSASALGAPMRGWHGPFVTQAATSTPATAPVESAVPLAARESPAAAHVTGYTLPPAEYAKARHLARIGYAAGILVPIYSLLVLYLMLRWGWSVKFRDWAEAAGPKLFPQAAIYSVAFFTTLSLSQLPIHAWFHWLYVVNGLVIQGWGSWLGDRGKQLGITTCIGMFMVYALFLLESRSPRRWWLYFWLMALPFFVFMIFLTPLVIDPMFNKFEPLTNHEPQLVSDLERVVNRVGLNIPPERMFWMNASAKAKFVNAYVTGLGASKRVVVWDTTISKMTRPEIAFIFGHEMGHYVLNHVYDGLIASCVGLFVVLFVTAWAARRCIARRGSAWKIRGPSDLAALPIYVIPIMVLTFLGTPITNGYLRYREHQADQFGLEVTHGINPDSAQVAADSFQVLGEIDLEDPAPNRLEIFWYYDHPWIEDRIQFALHYDPWAHGGTGEFVK